MRAPACLVIAWCAPCVLGAQVNSPVPLKPAAGAIADVPNPVMSVRELADGTVLISYGRGVLVANLKSGTKTPIPDLPGGTLTQLTADSTLMLSRAGWVLFDGVRPIGMLPSTNPTVAATQALFGADSAGYVLAVIDWQTVSDSLALVRMARANGARQVVAKVRMPPGVHAGEPGPAYTVAEQGVLFLDGWIAVLRAGPYRVDWRSPLGQWIRGVPLPVAPIALDEREKAAYIARSVRPPGLTTEAWMKEANWWPAFVEPFVGFALRTAPEGEVIVQRTPTADYPMPRYDVVNRRGEIVRQVKLEPNQRIIGFGRHDVFVLTPMTGTARIDQHPWP
jgi:hypothetical protein